MQTEIDKVLDHVQGSNDGTRFVVPGCSHWNEGRLNNSVPDSIYWCGVGPTLLEYYGLLDTCGRITPMSPNFYDELLAHADDHVPWESVIPDEDYWRLIGCLLFLSIRTRADIALSTSILAQYIPSQTAFLFKQAKWVLLYLKYTKHWALMYSKIATPSHPSFCEVRCELTVLSNEYSWHEFYAFLFNPISQDFCEFYSIL